ncbi:hypothetical protein YC2023_092551 [Brassica napus]
MGYTKVITWSDRINTNDFEDTNRQNVTMYFIEPFSTQNQSTPCHNISTTQNPEIARSGLVDDSSSHPWPEWLDLMGYFGECVTGSKESNHIRTARFDLILYGFLCIS